MSETPNDKHVLIDAGVHRELKIRAAHEGVSVKELLGRAAREFIERSKAKKSA